MNQLARYRQFTSSWAEVQFLPAENDTRGDFDANENARHRALLELQYDLQPTDYAFVRFLMEQEIAACRHDSFQGWGALELASYLLASFRVPEDIALFVQAKEANFDTGCGLDTLYIFAACRENTKTVIQTQFPALAQALAKDYWSLDFPPEFDDWWEARKAQFPSCEQAENLLTLFDRALAFNAPDKAVQHLQQWIAQEPDSPAKVSVMRYRYAELGDYANAALAEHCKWEHASTPWDRASACSDLIDLYRHAADFTAAAQMVRELDAVFARFKDWQGVGLGRMAIRSVFELVQQHPDDATAREVFALADQWFGKSRDLAWVGKEAGAKAALRCGLKDAAQRYQKLADQERARIDAALGKIRPAPPRATQN
jgi:hypothetical protein